MNIVSQRVYIVIGLNGVDYEKFTKTKIHLKYLSVKHSKKKKKKLLNKITETNFFFLLFPYKIPLASSFQHCTMYIHPSILFVLQVETI